MPLPDVLAAQAHRPWPLPARPWAMTQWWRELLFAHWPIPVAELAPLIPDSLSLDTFEGTAWIAVVPFRMTGVRPRGLPPFPPLSDFAELNLRTYVIPKSAKPAYPGVFFWSLEASSAFAVRVARTLFHLPYMDAAMTCATHQGWIDYHSRRTHKNEPPADFQARYRPRGPALKTPLVTWLTERYCLYSSSKSGRLYRGDIHHHPWPLMEAEALIETNTIARAAGIDLPHRPPLLHYSSELEVAIWPLTEVG